MKSVGYGINYPELTNTEALQASWRTSRTRAGKSPLCSINNAKTRCACCGFVRFFACSFPSHCIAAWLHKIVLMSGQIYPRKSIQSERTRSLRLKNPLQPTTAKQSTRLTPRKNESQIFHARRFTPWPLKIASPSPMISRSDEIHGHPQRLHQASDTSPHRRHPPPQFESPPVRTCPLHRTA